MTVNLVGSCNLPLDEVRTADLIGSLRQNHTFGSASAERFDAAYSDGRSVGGRSPFSGYNSLFRSNAQPRTRRT